MMKVASVVKRRRDGVREGKEEEEGGRASEWKPIFLSIFSPAEESFPLRISIKVTKAPP